MSLETLLRRLESETQTADGRTVRLCRDPGGHYWVVDGERVVSLGEFASGCSIAAREFCALARAAMLRRIAAVARDQLARVAERLHRGNPITARA
jgi:hypothetical protein